MDEEEKKEVDLSLIYNWLCDMRKKEIEPMQRANLLKHYMKEKNLSQRALAQRMGIPHSTVQDWVMFGRIEPEEYKDMKDTGLTDTDIYRVLRNNKKESKKEIIKKTKIDMELETCIKLLSSINLTKLVPSTNTADLVAQLKDTLNRILMYVEKNNGKK